MENKKTFGAYVSSAASGYGEQKDFGLSSDCDRTAHTFTPGFLPVSGRNLVSRSCYKCDLWSESLYHAGALIPASAVPVDGRKEDIHVFADRNRLTALFAAGL